MLRFSYRQLHTIDINEHKSKIMYHNEQLGISSQHSIAVVEALLTSEVWAVNSIEL